MLITNSQYKLNSNDLYTCGICMLTCLHDLNAILLYHFPMRVATLPGSLMAPVSLPSVKQ
jgi:hypothetical protein